MTPEKRERQLHTRLKPILRDIAGARQLSQELDSLIPPRELRRRACLVVRCDDCRGQVVAHVTYVQGRPMLWAAKQRGKPGHRSWVDSGYWGDVAWCRGREYYLHSDDLVAWIPPPGAAHVEQVRVSHDDK